jgi:tetratricopeptide (TPR) repeat protein
VKAALSVGNIAAAIEDLTSLTQVDTGNANAWRNRAMAYLDAGMYDMAIQDLKNAIQLDSNAKESLLCSVMLSGCQAGKPTPNEPFTNLCGLRSMKAGSPAISSSG